MGYTEKEAEKHLKDITGRDVKKTLTIEIDDFTNCACLGDVVSIIYKSNKKHLGDKGGQLYEHTFKPGTILISNGSQLLIYGTKLKINYRGVIN